MEFRKTRFVCVSDTHNSSPADGAFKLPKGDVLIHAGDLTKQGTYAELQRTLDWIEQADFEVKIVVAGWSSRHPNRINKLSGFSEAIMISPLIRISTRSMAFTSIINILKTPKLVLTWSKAINRLHSLTMKLPKYA